MLPTTIEEESDDSHKLSQMVEKIRLKSHTNPFMSHIKHKDKGISANIESVENYSRSHKLQADTPTRQMYSVEVCKEAGSPPKSMRIFQYLTELALSKVPMTLSIVPDHDKSLDKSPKANSPYSKIGHSPVHSKKSKGKNSSRKESKTSKGSKSNSRGLSKHSVASPYIVSSMQLFQQCANDM